MRDATHRDGIGSRAGYSLVEVTLALLVVAIGLVATFALFPVGLKATRDAVDDTEVSLFAEYVFSTLELAQAIRVRTGPSPIRICSSPRPWPGRPMCLTNPNSNCRKGNGRLSTGFRIFTVWTAPPLSIPIWMPASCRIFGRLPSPTNWNFRTATGKTKGTTSAW